MSTAELGRYWVLRQLERGRDGRVLEARSGDGGHVVLREIQSRDQAVARKLQADPDLQRLCAKIVGLSHQAVANTLEIFAVGARVYLAEQLVDFPALREVLRQAGCLPVEEAWGLVAQLLAGLEFGHQRGLLHLDLCPAHLCYHRQKHSVLLCAFGCTQLALELNPGLSLAARAGPYHAPEVRAGHPPTPAAEVYSAGTILHELLTGTLPSESGACAGTGRFDFLEVGESPLPRAGQLLEDLSQRWPGVITVLRRALSPRPEQRYQRAGQMLRALTQAHAADVRREPYREHTDSDAGPTSASEAKPAQVGSLRVHGGIRFCDSCGRPLAPSSESCLSCGARCHDLETASRPAQGYFSSHAERLLREGRYQEAERALRMAVRRAPDDAELQRRLGDVLTMNRRFREAETAYREALRLHPGDLQARYELARILVTQNRGWEALGELQRLVKLDSLGTMYSAAVTLMGAAWSSVGHPDTARRYWEQALEVDPDNPHLHMSVGMSYAAEGELTEAAYHLGRALEIDPDYHAAAAALRRIEAELAALPSAPTLSGYSLGYTAMPTLLLEALSQLGADLGPEEWGGHAARATWPWVDEDDWWDDGTEHGDDSPLLIEGPDLEPEEDQ